jgi:hypothetical protein
MGKENGTRGKTNNVLSINAQMVLKYILKMKMKTVVGDG